MSNRRVELQRSPEHAWAVLKSAAAALGKVSETSDSTRFLIMRARYGLNPVRLRIAVLSGATPNTSVIEIQGRGQDVMGVASRKVIDKLVMALG
jgi:hypothetical protein